MSKTKLDSETLLDIFLEDTKDLSRQELAEYGMECVDQFALDMGLIACMFGPKRAYLVLLEAANSIAANPEAWNMLVDTAKDMHALHNGEVSDV